MKLTRAQYRRALRSQKILGIVLILISAVIFFFAATAALPADQDATAALILLPLGAWMTLTRNLILY